MKAEDFRLGLRVRRRGGETSFVRDPSGGQASRNPRIGIVVGLPRAIAARHRVVDVQWERSSRTEEVHIFRLEALPLEQQPVALGGRWTASPDTFVVRRKAVA